MCLVFRTNQPPYEGEDKIKAYKILSLDSTGVYTPCQGVDFELDENGFFHADSEIDILYDDLDGKSFLYGGVIHCHRTLENANKQYYLFQQYYEMNKSFIVIEVIGFKKKEIELVKCFS